MALTRIKASNITDGTVVAAEIADDAIVADKIANNAVTDAKISAVAASKLTGTIAAARLGTGASATTFLRGDSTYTTAGSTSASDLTSGTLPDARFPATLPAVNGSALTNLPVSTYASAAGAGHTGIAGNQSVPTTTLTKLTFSHELYDDDSNFDLANERYTAPATGKYWVSCSVGMSTSFGSGQRGVLKLYKNGAAAFSPLNDITAECNTSTTSEINATINVVVPLSQNDYLEAMFIHFKGSTQTIGGPKTWLQVYRLS